MSDTASEAVIVPPQRLRLSPVWLIPLAAVLIGIWLVYQNAASQGPQIVLALDTAEGVEAGKTVIKLHDVDVGLVEEVRLSDDYTGAIAEVRMKSAMAPLLVDDTLFWVVKPRIGRQGVSGLGTLLSGAYIKMRPGKMQPGTVKNSSRHFKVLNQPPASRANAQGLSLELVSPGSESLNIGDPIIYQGQEIGQIETAEFNTKMLEMSYGVFIRAPFDELITSNTQFWPRSGIDFQITSEGLNVQTSTLQAMLTGGITFGVPAGVIDGGEVAQGAKFRLYASRQAAIQERFDRQYKYLALFNDSVRGLHNGAAVEYRGIRVGTVLEVPFFGDDLNLASMRRQSIPVLIAFEPQRLDNAWSRLDQQAWEQRMAELFDNGLRATIKAANLLTGAMFVDLSFTSQKGYEGQEYIDQYPVLPSRSSGLSGIEDKVTTLLDKFNSLELNPVLEELKGTLKNARLVMSRARVTVDKLNSVLDDEATRGMPAELSATLDEIQATLTGYQQGAPVYDKLYRSLDRLNQIMDDFAPLVETLRDDPTRLLFGGDDDEDDPVPKAAR